MTGRWRSRRCDRGSAAVYAVMAVGLLVVAALGAVTVAGIVAGHRKAAAAADLAALAGASAVQRGRPACAAAVEIAEANRSRLVGCSVLGPVVQVEVIVEVGSPFETWSMRGRARAGPVRSSGADGPVRAW